MAEIVPATRALLDEVEAWLRVEDGAYRQASAKLAERWDPDIEIPERGFFCNWHLVRRSFERDPGNVHVLVVDGAAVGFVDEMDILEIHPALRGLGYGRILADFMLRRAFDLGHSVAEIEIAPDSALPFWNVMGFTVDPSRQGGGGGVYAFRRFDRDQVLGSGERTAYRIAFHDPARGWDPKIEPFAVFEGQGEVQDDGSVLLPTRAYCFDPHHETSIDCVVRVELAGACLYEDKVKRPSARDFGLQQDPGGIFYFDRLLAPKAPPA